jgi:hypothetical protein
MRSLAVLAAVCGAVAFAQSPAPPASTPPKAAPPSTTPRARLGAVAQRNENVAVWQIDNNAVKEANIRVGTRATASDFNNIESAYFASEHGQAPSETLLLPSTTIRDGWHGEAFANHQNSVFNARTFFQVGPVLPSRRNHYGFRASGAAGPLGYLTLSGFQRKIRGMVNGNVLVPLAHERTPLATDPAVRAIVQRFLDAYPDELPNRPDFDPRALNTNSPQRIDDLDGTMRLDRDTSENGRLSLTYGITRSRTSAFQLVAGQNPDTDIHSHRARVTWRKSLSAATTVVLGAGFARTRSVLLPEPNAVGPRVRLGFQIEELGPDSQFPINRAQNSFRYGAQVAQQRGSHALTWGADITRYQLNGIETNNQRGYFWFTNNFGRQAIENLRLGTPSSYEVTIGDLARGFRNWYGNLYAADRWRINSRVQLYYGVRYSFIGAPSEVQDRDRIPYDCDCNNLSPRLSLAVRLSPSWTLRTSGTISFSPIQPVTYQQIRNNLPLVRYVQVQSPSLVDPLQGVDLNSPAARVSPTVLSPDLTSPYSHQYNLVLEKRLLDRYNLRAGYIGSRSVKLINTFTMNRADPVPGIPLTLDTVDLRRPDPHYYEVKHIVNAGNAYFDAGFFTFEMPLRNGLTLAATYTFSKAIDEGSDFTTTAANKDLLSNRSQWQYETLKDRKGLSNFDSPHSLLLDFGYVLPGGRNWLTRGWQVSGAALWKAGTPCTLFIGSDSPGYGNVDGGPSDRPHILDPSILGVTIGDPNIAPSILRRDRFAFMSPGETRGSVGRNTFRKSPISNLNAALARQWSFTRNGHEWTTQFRIEAYNLTNTPQFDEPQRNLSSPSFGRITNTLNDGRVLQFGLRLVL